MTHTPLKGLRAQREKQGLSQVEVAEAIDVTQSQYHKFETGAVRLDLLRAAILAKRLGCRIEELI